MLNMNHICKACLKMKMHLEHHQVDSIKPRIATDHEVLMAPNQPLHDLGLLLAWANKIPSKAGDVRSAMWISTFPTSGIQMYPRHDPYFVRFWFIVTSL